MITPTFFLIPGTQQADFGVAPEGAELIDLSGSAPFRDRSISVLALEEIQRLHLRWYRGQSGGDRARLDGARLVGARLDGASLDRASLDRASLDGASLVGASLVGARLVGASLVGASLDRASLVGASLDGASLDGASLDRARLDGARLDPIRDDLYRVLDAVPAEVPALLAALREGRVDGSTYSGNCACLVGTIANARGCTYSAIPGLTPNADRPAERWFLAIRPGLPVTHPVVAITIGWVERWMAGREVAPSGKENDDG